MTIFTLDKGTFGSPVLEIDEATAIKASSAKKVIIDMLTAEEKYDAIVENFVEFERDLFEVTLDYKMFGGRTEDWFNIARNTLDRRFFNLLSTCRSYLEFGTHCAKEIAADMDTLKKEQARHFDQSFAYRLMEGLRNQITYAGHAAHVVTFSAEREDVGEGDFLLTYNTPTLELLAGRLTSNEKLSKKLLNEISNGDDKIDLLPLLREYVRRLSELHEFFRGLCRAEVASSRSFLEDVFAKFRIAHPATEDFRGLVLRESKEGVQINEFWIVPNAERLNLFESKNRVLSNLERSRITNAVPRNI